MSTAITYGLPPERKTVYLTSVTIKRQAGGYSLEPPVPQGDWEPAVAERVLQALERVVAELNGK
jgi:hypothetical protein